MRIVTFNLRCDTAKDGVNSFTHRRGLVIDRLETENADIVGFQEVMPGMQEYLRAHLRDYTIAGCGRESDYSGEHNPIAFLTDKYELLGLDVSWLSFSPYMPGSRFPEQSRCPRIVTHALLRPALPGGAPFHAYNTHLDHVSSEARAMGAKRLLEKMAEDQRTHPFPITLTGDFNAVPDSPEMRMLSEDAFGLTDQTEGVGTTWHDWGRETGGRIDYVFTRGFVRENGPELWMEARRELYLSDHYPVGVTLKREDGGAC